MRILVVDDDLSILECLTDGLEAVGHTVHQAATFADALDLLRSLLVDAVISDGRLPVFRADDPPTNCGPDITKVARNLLIPALLHSGDVDLVEAESLAGGKALMKPASVAEILQALGS